MARDLGARIRKGIRKDLLDDAAPDFDPEIEEIVTELESMSVDAAGDDADYTLKAHVAGWVDSLYDWADMNRVWLDSTRRRTSVVSGRR